MGNIACTFLCACVWLGVCLRMRVCMSMCVFEEPVWSEQFIEFQKYAKVFSTSGSPSVVQNTVPHEVRKRQTKLRCSNVCAKKICHMYL